VVRARVGAQRNHRRTRRDRAGARIGRALGVRGTENQARVRVGDEEGRPHRAMRRGRLPHGTDLRLWADGELRRTQLCRSQKELIDTQHEWREALKAKGWTNDG
jgi:hypothetical protein